MPSLREEFVAKARAEGITPHEKDCAAGFEKIEKILSNTIARRARLQDRREVFFSVKTGNEAISNVGTIEKIASHEEEYIRTLEAYRRLHEICRDPAMDVEIDLGRHPFVSRELDTSLYIIISLDRPYSHSEDKDIVFSPVTEAVAPVPEVIESLKYGTPEERQRVIKHIKNAFPEDFNAVAGVKPGAALTRPIPAVKPVVPPAPQN